MPTPNVILIVGDPKTGKTISACTFPKPLRLVDFDGGGYKSIYAKDDGGNPLLSDSSEVEIVEIVKEKSHEINFYRNLKVKQAPAHVSEAQQLISKMNDVTNDLEVSKISTLVYDSLTSMFRLWKEAVLYQNSQMGLQIQDYQTLEEVLYSQFIPSLKNLPVDYVILIDHTMVDKDEVSGMISEFPVGPSRNMGRQLPQQFDEVWQQKYEMGSYVWETRSSGLFIGSGSRTNLPEKINPATFEEVNKFWGKG